jgi:hypothetical protein
VRHRSIELDLDACSSPPVTTVAGEIDMVTAPQRRDRPVT